MLHINIILSTIQSIRTSIIIAVNTGKTNDCSFKLRNGAFL